MEATKNKMDEKPVKGSWAERFKVPNSLVLLFGLVILVSMLTYIIPAGAFDQVKDEKTGKMLVLAGTYHTIEGNPTTPFEVFTSIPRGMEEAGYIIFFLLIIGGAFKVLQATGAVESGIGHLVKNMQGKEKLIIPVIMVVFCVGGAILGVAEESLAFMPMIVALCLALGFDSIVGTAILLLSSAAGYAGAMLNPFTVGVAQGIAGLPLFSGMGFRIIAFGIFTVVTIAYVMIYAARIQKNPKLSSMYEIDLLRRKAYNQEDLPKFTIRHKLVLLSLLAGVVFLAYGVMKLGFYITELGAIFLIVGIVAGIVGGMKLETIADEFVKGASDLLFACLIIGFARAMLVVMKDANIMDTVINACANTIQGLPTSISAVGMMFVQSIISVIIPSGSGQAAVSIPIMAPIGDVLGITRQTTVLAYQFADAFSNVLTPTSGFFMAAIAMSGISWTKWAKWFLPLFLLWFVIGAILVIVAVNIGYGPF